MVKANVHFSDLIWIRSVVTDHSLLKLSSLVSKIMQTPGFLFKSWGGVLLIQQISFFACTLDVLLVVSLWLYPHLLTWESSRSFSYLGNLLAVNYMQAKNTYLYLYYFQTPIAYWTFSTLMSQRPATACPSLKFCSTTFFIFFIKVIEYCHWQRISFWPNYSGSSELFSVRLTFGLSCLSLCYPILSKNPAKSLKPESPILNIWSFLIPCSRWWLVTLAGLQKKTY